MPETTQLRLGSLFSGALAGGLDLAIEDVFGAELRWVSDIIARDKHGRQIGDAPRILAHRFPNVPNLGDITTIDWAGVEPVDIVAGGSPCQDVSSAGKRAGMVDDTRSNLWVAMRDAIAHTQPALVIWENVRGATSARAASAMESDPRLLGDHQPGFPTLRALGRVLGDLADLGFDAAWCGLRAADVGSCHGRFRIFVVAAHPERVARLQWGVATPTQTEVGRPLCAVARRGGASGLGLLPTPRASSGASDTETVALLPTPVTTDGKSRSAGDLRRKSPGLRSVSDLLPTPSAGNFNASESPEQWEARVQESAANGNGMGMPLGIAVQLLPTPKASNNENRQSLDRYGMNLGQALGITPLLPTPRATDGTKGGPNQRGSSGDLTLPSAVHRWGKYAAAIARWESLTRPAPAPTMTDKNGRPRLNPQFSEWMQGWPAGWVTDVPGMRDTWKHHAIGNGVVPQQASAAIRWCLSRLEALGGAA